MLVLLKLGRLCPRLARLGYSLQVLTALTGVSDNAGDIRRDTDWRSLVEIPGIANMHVGAVLFRKHGRGCLALFTIVFQNDIKITAQKPVNDKY